MRPLISVTVTSISIFLWQWQDGGSSFARPSANTVATLPSSSSVTESITCGFSARPVSYTHLGLNNPPYENYVKMFKDPLMSTAIKNTLILMALTVVIQVGLALILALLVDQIKFGSQFFRTVYFFPIVISATALGLLFNLRCV